MTDKTARQPEKPARQRTMVDKFWFYVVTHDVGCWEWTGGTEKGYGRVHINGTRTGKILAHRLSALIHFGMLDSRWDVLHACDNPPCTRPDHLRIGDHAQNMREMSERGRTARVRSSWTHCVQGHEFTPENTYTNEVTGHRRCRECRRVSNHAAHLRRVYSR